MSNNNARNVPLAANVDMHYIYLIVIDEYLFQTFLVFLIHSKKEAYSTGPHLPKGHSACFNHVLRLIKHPHSLHVRVGLKSLSHPRQVSYLPSRICLVV